MRIPLRSAASEQQQFWWTPLFHLSALAVLQGMLLHLFKHQNTIGFGRGGLTIGRTLCEVNAMPNLSCSSCAKKAAGVCMALLMGLHEWGFFAGKPWQHLF